MKSEFALVHIHRHHCHLVLTLTFELPIHIYIFLFIYLGHSDSWSPEKQTYKMGQKRILHSS